MKNTISIIALSIVLFANSIIYAQNKRNGVTKSVVKVKVDSTKLANFFINQNDTLSIEQIFDNFINFYDQNLDPEDVLKKRNDIYIKKGNYNNTNGNFYELYQSRSGKINPVLYKPVLTSKTISFYPPSKIVTWKTTISDNAGYSSCYPDRECTYNAKDPFLSLKAIFNLDIIQYYQLDNLYNTDLKKQVFIESPAYKDSLTSIKKLKKSILNENFFFQTVNHTDYNLGSESNSGVTYSTDLGTDIFEGSYNLSIGGFVLKNSCMQASKVLFNFYLKQLPDIYRPDNTGNCDFLVISVDKVKGLEMENNISNLRCLWCFKIKDEFTTKKMVLGNEYLSSTSAIRLIIYDHITYKIYYDKLYK